MTTPDQPQYAPTPAPKAASGLYIRLADLLVAVGGIIIVLFSWAPVIGFNDSADNEHIHRSLWTWLSPLGLFVIVGALVLIGSAIIDTWWKRDKQIVGVNRHHIQVGVALFVLLVIFGMAFADPFKAFGVADFGFGISYGGGIQLLGAIVAAAGAILNHFNQMQNPIGLPSVSVKSAPPVAYPPAQQGYAPPPQPGYAPPQPTQVDPQNPPTA